MTEKAHETYAVQHTTVIVTGFLLHLSSRFLLPQSNFHPFFTARRKWCLSQLWELQVDVEGKTYTVISIKCYMLVVYCKRRYFCSRLILRASNTHKNIKPTKICSHEELATAITVGYSHPRKFIPLNF